MREFLYESSFYTGERINGRDKMHSRLQGDPVSITLAERAENLLCWHSFQMVFEGSGWAVGSLVKFFKST